MIAAQFPHILEKWGFSLSSVGRWHSLKCAWGPHVGNLATFVVIQGTRGAFLMLLLYIYVCVLFLLFCWFLFAVPHISPRIRVYTEEFVNINWSNAFLTKIMDIIYWVSTMWKACSLALCIHYFICSLQYHVRLSFIRPFLWMSDKRLKEVKTLPYIRVNIFTAGRADKDCMVQWFPNVSPWTAYIWDLVKSTMNRVHLGDSDSMGLRWCPWLRTVRKLLWCCWCNSKFIIPVHYF